MITRLLFACWIITCTFALGAKTAAAQTGGTRIGSKELPTESVAAQATRLEAAIIDDEQRIRNLRGILKNPEDELTRAEAAYKSSATRLQQTEAGVSAALDEATKQAGQRALDDLQRIHALARERYDLAIETRKILQQHLSILEAKARGSRAALLALTGRLPTLAVNETLTNSLGTGRDGVDSSAAVPSPLRLAPNPNAHSARSDIRDDRRGDHGIEIHKQGIAQGRARGQAASDRIRTSRAASHRRCRSLDDAREGSRLRNRTPRCDA